MEIKYICNYIGECQFMYDFIIKNNIKYDKCNIDNITLKEKYNGCCKYRREHAN